MKDETKFKEQEQPSLELVSLDREDDNDYESEEDLGLFWFRDTIQLFWLVAKPFCVGQI